MNHSVRLPTPDGAVPNLQAPQRSWRALPLARHLGEHSADWDRLNDTLFSGHAMLSSLFINGLLAHFGDGSEQLCLLDYGGTVEAMCILRKHSWWQWAVFLPAQAQLCPLLIQGEQQLSGLIQSLPGHVLALDLLKVDPALISLPVSVANTMRWYQASTMSIRLAGGLSAYWDARPASLRQNLRRLEKRSAEDFKRVEHRWFSAPADVHAAIDRYCDLEAAGWKGLAGTALSPGNRQASFYSEVLLDAARRGIAEVHELWFDHVLAASRLVLLNGSQFVMLKTSYDENLAKYAPGRILLAKFLAQAFERMPGGCVEFQTDADHNLLAWATDFRPIRHIRAFRHGGAQLCLMSLRLMQRALMRPSETAPARLSVAVYKHPSELPLNAQRLLHVSEERIGVEIGADWLKVMTEQVFAPPAQPRLFVLSEDSAVLAILPMVAEHPHASEVKTLGNFYTAMGPPVIRLGTQPASLVPLIQAVCKEWPRAGKFNFGPMDPESLEFGILRAALEKCGFVPFRYFRFGRWSLDCASLSYKEYLGQREGTIRSTLARASKKFAAKGGHMEIVAGGERLEIGIDAYQKVYANSWKGAEPFPEFIAELMRRCAAKGWLRLGISWLEGKPIAAQIWISAHGRTEIFKLAYDEAYKSIAAGTLLTALLMQQAMDEDRIKEVDYLIGDDAYKVAWMNRRDERWGILAYDPVSITGSAGLLRHILGLSFRRLQAAVSKRWHRV